MLELSHLCLLRHRSNSFGKRERKASAAYRLLAAQGPDLHVKIGVREGCERKINEPSVRSGPNRGVSVQAYEPYESRSTAFTAGFSRTEHVV